MSERIRALNEEMANEPPMPEEGPTQSSVKFKDTLVDFISPTPEPQLDSEEDPATLPSTPRSDADEQSPRQLDSSDTEAGKSDAETADNTCSSTEKSRTSDRSRTTRNTMLAAKILGYFEKQNESPRAVTSSTVSEDSSALSIQAGEHDQQVDSGARKSPTFPSEAALNKSDQNLNSPHNKEIPVNNPADTESSPTNAETSSPALKTERVKPEADKTSRSASNKQKTQTSGRSRVNRNATPKVVSGFEKPTGSRRAKPVEVKTSLKTDTKSNPDTPSAAPDMETARSNMETTGSPELMENQTFQVWLQYTPKFNIVSRPHKILRPSR